MPAPGFPQSPPPEPTGFGFSGESGSSPPAGLSLLLLVLAAELAVLAAPRLGRRVSLALAVPRAHPYLLRLERPD